MKTLKSNKRRRIATPTSSARNDGRGGFTLVELVITVAIVVILSVISVPLYRGYVDKAKLSEGYALLGAILSAQKAYYSEYGNFLAHDNSGKYTSNEVVLGIDARGNKYCTYFHAGEWVTNCNPKICFGARIWVPIEIMKSGDYCMALSYNITKGNIFADWPSKNSEYTSYWEK